MGRTASSWAKPSTSPRITQAEREWLYWTAFWKAAGAVLLKKAFKQQEHRCSAVAAARGWVALLWAKQQSVPGGEVLPRSLLTLSWLQPPMPSSNLTYMPHSRKQKNVWGQRERKMSQGRASSAGMCKVSMIGGAWKYLQMKETLNGEEGLVLSGKRRNGRNGLI